jgi:cytidylate kinase
VRGQRRFDQLDQQGHAPAPPPEEIVRDLRARDERDRNRADSPLKPAADAILLDSTNMSLEQAVAAARAIVEAKLGSAAAS